MIYNIYIYIHMCMSRSMKKSKDRGTDVGGDVEQTFNLTTSPRRTPKP